VPFAVAKWFISPMESKSSQRKLTENPHFSKLVFVAAVFFGNEFMEKVFSDLDITDCIMEKENLVLTLLHLAAIGQILIVLNFFLLNTKRNIRSYRLVIYYMFESIEVRKYGKV